MSPAERGLTVLVVLLGAVLVLAVGAVGLVWWRVDGEVTHWKTRCEEERRLFEEALMQRDKAMEQLQTARLDWEREKAELQRTVNQLTSRLNDRDQTVAILRSEKEALDQRAKALARKLEALKSAGPSAGGADGAAGAS